MDKTEQIKNALNDTVVVETQNLVYNEKTLEKVRKVLETEVSPQTATDLINDMQNDGILFRERA